MLICESCVTHFLAENIRAVIEVNPAFARRVSFCTDDVIASDILEEGHLDNVVRLAIKAEVEPITAIPDYAITDVGLVDYCNLTIFDPILNIREK